MAAPDSVRRIRTHSLAEQAIDAAERTLESAKRIKAADAVIEGAKR